MRHCRHCYVVFAGLMLCLDARLSHSSIEFVNRIEYTTEYYYTILSVREPLVDMPLSEPAPSVKLET